jgi:hypothetical protein
MAIERARKTNLQQSKFQKLIKKVKNWWFQPLFYELKATPRNNEPKTVPPHPLPVSELKQQDKQNLSEIVRSIFSYLENGTLDDVNSLSLITQWKIQHNHATCSSFFALSDDDKQIYIKHSLWLWNTSHIKITAIEQRYSIPIVYVQNNADLINKFGKSKFFYHQAKHCIIVIDQGNEGLDRFYSTYPIAKSILSVLPVPRSSSDDMHIRMMLPYLPLSDVSSNQNTSNTIVQVIQKNSTPNNHESISKLWNELMWLYQAMKKYEPDAFRRMIMLAMTPYVYHSKLIWHLSDSNPHAHQP